MYNPQLVTFIQCCRCGSFTKAAEALYIIALAVIKQINLLESDLGLELFVHTHKGLTLTEAGKSLYCDAKYLVEYSKESVVCVKHTMQGDESVIGIGTSPMTPGHFW